jgi:hypothetical protein
MLSSGGRHEGVDRMRSYLIVANLTLAGDRLWDVVRARMDEGPCRFHVLAPATHDPMMGAWTEVEARAQAAERVDRALARLRELGAEATGEVGDIRTVDATLDALRGHDYDEIIISTLPPNASRWLRLDLVSRLRRAVPVPVTHVIGQPEHVGA